MFMRVPTLVWGVIAPQTLRTSTLPQALAPTEVPLLILALLFQRKQGGALANFLAGPTRDVRAASIFPCPSASGTA